MLFFSKSSYSEMWEMPIFIVLEGIYILGARSEKHLLV